MKKVVLLFVLFISGHNLYSQKLCGVVLTPEKIALERARLASPPSLDAPPQCCLDKILSMTFWIVKDSSGQTNVSNADITQAVNDLNTHFIPICLSFNVCAINYIDDWNYDSLYFPNERDQLY